MAFKSRLGRPRLEPCLQGVLFLGLFFTLWKGIETQLLFYGFGVFTPYPIFSSEGSFPGTFFSTPGGVLNALGAILTQSYSSAWLGALVITSGLGVLFLGIQRLLKSLQAECFRDLAWIPLIVTLMIYSHYDNPLPILLAIGLSIWAAVICDSLSGRSLARRAGVFLACFAVVYILGAASAFVFAVIVCVRESLFHRRIIQAILLGILACVGAFVMGRFLFGLDLPKLYLIGTPWDPGVDYRFSPLSTMLAIGLYAFVPGLIAATGLVRALIRTVLRVRPDHGKPNGESTPLPKRVKHRKAHGVASNHSHPVSHARTQRRQEKIVTRSVKASMRDMNHPAWTALRTLVVGVTAVACLMLSRTHIRDERALNYYARQRDWDHVLSLGRRMRAKHAFTRSGVFDINRALAHSGRLAEELCAYPQEDIDTLFFSFEGMTGRLQYAKSLELYLDLGYLNAAEKTAYELLENEGPSPYTLEALVRIHLAKDQYQSAQIAFNALRKYVGAQVYVNKWQDVMTDPNRISGHALIQSWRKVASTHDAAVKGIAFEPILKRLLLDTPDHRLAYEYLMAYYLLKHQRAQLVSCLPLLRSLQYAKLPRHCAEALLVYALETKTPVDSQTWAIDATLKQQSRDITSVIKKAGGDDQAIFDALAPKYGDTYTFYSLFNVCGVK